MAKSQRRLILANGEQYRTDVEKKRIGRPSPLPRDFEEARDLVKRGITTAMATVDSLPASKRLPNEMVLCLRLHPDMSAKSYDPAPILARVPGLQNIGSREYRTSIKDVKVTERLQARADDGETVVNGRLVFVRSTTGGFNRLLRTLDLPPERLPQDFRDEICRVERFDTLSTAEQVLGFEKGWKEGRVELVIHPTGHNQQKYFEFLNTLLHEAGINWEGATIREYPNVVFISCRTTRQGISQLEGANPLRSVQPLELHELEELRNQPTLAGPRPPSVATRSTIKVGMFDGGADINNALLLGHVEEDAELSIKTAPDAKGIAHGTAVAGVLLHGPLNDYSPQDELPAPPISVVSIRALPTSNPHDIDLYESIDVIEEAVPARKDIKVFAVNFGPRGPICDDTLSRFTYVLDSLSVSHKVTFVVAAGNDGDASDLDLRRIQAPSDLAHGICVGAYSFDDDRRPVRAYYSCVGPGRECAKNKPDVSAFGGCPKHPMHLVSVAPGSRVLACGTSFAGPCVARLVAQGTEYFDRANPLLGRALTIQTAAHPDGVPDHALGHGCIPHSVDDLIYCEENSVTIVFQGALAPRRSIRLPILLPLNLQGRRCIFTWTIAALMPVDVNHPADYTCCCVEDTFYPNNRMFEFSKKASGKRVTKDVSLDRQDLVAQLQQDGWKQSEFPCSASGNKYRTEHDRRALDCKWEPIVRRRLAKKAASLADPFLVLQPIARHNVMSQFDYAAVVTVSIPGFEGDLYTEVRERFTALVPIRVRAESEIRVRI